MRYIISQNKFEDDSVLEWDIRTPIESAKIRNPERVITITAAYLDACIVMEEDVDEDYELTVLLPILRGCDGVHKINVKLSELTIRTYMQDLYNFYHNPITDEQLWEIQWRLETDDEYSVRYIQQVVKRHHNMSWIDYNDYLDNEYGHQPSEIKYAGIVPNSGEFGEDFPNLKIA